MTERRRILVVDDQPEILDLTRMVLTGAGYDAVTAASGSEALGLVALEPFDLVLLDINMPDMDGWETLRCLRADEELEDLVVVMFSVKGEVSDRVQCLQEGATGYITKPFVVDDLVRRIQDVLDARATGDDERSPSGSVR